MNIFHETLLKYIAFYETLSPATVGQLDDLLHENARFSDPFNDVRGTDSIKHIFSDMFQKIRSPRFMVHGYGWLEGGEGSAAVLYWTLTYNNGSEITGMSRVVFHEGGKIMEHIDYWDSGLYFYEKIPVLGMVVRMVRRMMAVG